MLKLFDKRRTDNKFSIFEKQSRIRRTASANQIFVICGTQICGTLKLTPFSIESFKDVLLGDTALATCRSVIILTIGDKLWLRLLVGVTVTFFSLEQQAY